MKTFDDTQSHQIRTRKIYLLIKNFVLKYPYLIYCLIKHMNLCCIVTTDDCIVYTHVYAGMLKQILVFVLNCLKHKNFVFRNESGWYLTG